MSGETDKVNILVHELWKVVSHFSEWVTRLPYIMVQFLLNSVCHMNYYTTVLPCSQPQY